MNLYFTGELGINSCSKDHKIDIGLGSCGFAELYGKILFYDVREALANRNELAYKSAP